MGKQMIWKRLSSLLAMLGILTLGLAPVPVMADASNTRFVPRHAKAKAKPRAVRRAAAKPAAIQPAPQQPAPVEVAQPAPAPAVEPPAPFVAEAPATPAPAAAKLSVVKKGGNGTIVALLAAAVVATGIALATSGKSVSR